VKTLNSIAILLLACSSACIAQQNTPHAGYVYPAGGKQGTTFDVLVGGQFLNGVNGVLVSGTGIHASVAEYIKPIQAGQASMLRDRMKVLMEKWAAQNSVNRTGAAKTTEIKPVDKWTESDTQEIRDIRIKLAIFQRRRMTNVSIAEQARITIKIAADAPVGQRELRLQTLNGVTNPIYFFVGRLPEWSKPAAGFLTPEETAELGNGGSLRKQLQAKEGAAPPSPVVEIASPILVNGQVSQGGVDRYRFPAHKGERLVIAASARELIPYIADAVPGWFQASLTLYDPAGKELQYADHYSFHPDPVLLYEIPSDGEYTVAIHDSIYRGREDFVYRIAIGEIPFVTGMFPLGGRAGAKTSVDFTGWNLAQTHLVERSRNKDKGVELLSPGEEEFNARPFALDTLPETLAKDSNHARSSAQKISLPLIVNGRISRPGETQFFQFKGKAAEEIEAEVYARRLDSPLDSVLTLLDAGGKVLATNDDFADEGAGLITDQADSLLHIKLPADGIYYLRLGDSVGKGGPDFAYRLRVSQPNPDFELRITPSSLNVRAGETVPVSVHALRRGGFTGDILLKLKDAPRGFQLSGGVIPGNQSQLRMTLTVPQDAESRSTSHLSFEGFATIGGKDVHRWSVPADDREQAFFYHHLVTTKDLLVTVNGQRRELPSWFAHSDHPLMLIAGQVVGIKFDMTSDLAARVKLALSDPPEGITLDRVTPFADGGITVHLKVDGVKAKAGMRGNLLLTASVERPSPPQQAKNRPRGNAITLLLPAFPFEIFSTAPPAITQAALPQQKNNTKP
jgi:hypothetical protein